MTTVGERPILVDGRWSAQKSGIGRFSREILAQLAWNNSLDAGKPWSAWDVLNPRRISISRRAILYSPGYNAGITGARQLVTVHDLMHLGSEGSALKRAYYARIVRPAIVRCGMVLTVSETSAADIREWLGSSAVDIRVVGNGNSFPIPTDQQLLDFRAARVARSGPMRLLYVGNLKRHKNFPTVLRTLERLPEARLVVVTGDRDLLERTCAAYDPSVRERTSCRSEVSEKDLSSLYREADVLLMPSEEEGFGLPGLEALAHALPVVYWRGCRGLHETVGLLGRAIDDPYDGASWASAATAAAAEGVGSAERVVRHLRRHDWSRVAERVRDAVVDLAERQ